MVHKSFFAFFWGSILLMTSCGQSRHDFIQFDNIKGESWTYADTFNFYFLPKDSGKYRISLAVRHEKEYEFSNIWLKVTDLTGPNRIELPLFNPQGQPLGECSSGLCTQVVSWKDIDCQKGDSLYYSIVQNMRREPLEYISEIGVMIDRLPGNQ